MLYLTQREGGVLCPYLHKHSELFYHHYYSNVKYKFVNPGFFQSLMALFLVLKATPHNSARADPEKIWVLIKALFRRCTLCTSRKSDEIRAQIFQEMPKADCAVLPKQHGGTETVPPCCCFIMPPHRRGRCLYRPVWHIAVFAALPGACPGSRVSPPGRSGDRPLRIRCPQSCSFLRLRAEPRMVAAPTKEVRHRPDQRPRWDMSPVFGLVLVLLKMTSYSIGPVMLPRA